MSFGPPLAGEDFACAACGLDFTTLTVADARSVLSTLPDDLRGAMDGVARLRGRRDPAVWSAVEYACHLRDVAALFTVRLWRTRTEDDPRSEPLYADRRAEWFAYDAADPAAVLVEVRAYVAGLLGEVDATTEWERTIWVRPDDRRTAGWLVRQTAHEARHHVADIARVGAG